MTDRPNLSREGVQKLNFVGQKGNQLVYQGLNNKVIMLDVETVTRLGMNDVRSRKNKSVTKQVEEDIWSGSRTSPKDRLATAKLIEILKQYNVDGELFSSKKMRRREVWSEIASKMMGAGFHFANKETAWEKVSQKWRNLERTYRTQLSTNSKSLDIARTNYEFFDDLHELLSRKYSTDGSLVDDSRDSSVADADENQSIVLNEDVDYEGSTPESEEPTINDVQQEGEVTDEFSAEITQADGCYDTYVDNEIPQSPTIFDDKNLVFASDINLEDGLPFNPHTSSVRDPVLRLMLEMRAQERAHFREERRERLKLQKEMLEFRRDLVQLLSQQHQERMDAMYALVDAIKGGVDNKKSRFNSEKRLDKTSLELNLPNGKRKRRHSGDESSSSQSSSRRSIR